MEWAMEMKVLLIVLVFPKWPLATDTLLQESSLAGMPLSDAEYEYLFQTLTARQVLHVVCLRRAIFGCHDPPIQALDLYENHGIIPDGWICSNFPDNISFPDFCNFALYRCIVKKYFAKRVLCPDERTQKSTVTQTSQEVTPDNIVTSMTEMSSELPDITTSTESTPELLATMETAAAEISTTPLPTRTAKASLLKLLSSSAIETATKVISRILAALTAASESATSEPLMELIPASAATAIPESSSKLTTTTTTTAEFLIELTSTAAIITEPELNPATAATVAAPTQVTTAAPTESFSESATAMELFPESTSDTESVFDPTAHTTTTTSNIEPCIVDYPEPLDTSTTSTSSTSTSTSATSSTSILPIHTATTPTKAAAPSSTTTASPQPFVPGFDAPLLFPPPQPNSTLRVLILSFFRDKKVTNGDMAGIGALPQTGLGSGNILQQEAILNPLPTNGLKDLFLRLHNKSVQQLIHKMQDGISGEQQPQLLSSALKLLRALNPRSDFKNRLQR